MDFNLGVITTRADKTMNTNIKQIIKKAWNRCNKEEENFLKKPGSMEIKVNLLLTYVYIIVMEIEMSGIVSQLDVDAIKVIRNMKIDEWKTVWEKIYKDVPTPTDKFIKERILNTVASDIDEDLTCVLKKSRLK